VSKKLGNKQSLSGATQATKQEGVKKAKGSAGYEDGIKNKKMLWKERSLVKGVLSFLRTKNRPGFVNKTRSEYERIQRD